MLADKICPGCSDDVKLVRNCKAVKCAKEKGLENCLKCSNRIIFGMPDMGVCKIYSDATRHCPLRISMLCRFAENEKKA